MAAALTGAFLAANAALLLSWVLLTLFDGFLSRTGLAQAWSLRRRLVAGAWAVSLALPLCLALIPALPVNATDWLVAEFLRGNTALTQISATEFAGLIEAREDLPRSLSEAQGPVWRIVCAMVVTAALYRMIRIGISVLQVRTLVADARVVRDLRGLRVSVSSTCSVPFATAGLRRHHIVLPLTVWATPNQRRMALAHELQHLRQADPVWELAMAALSPLFALNPAFWALTRRTRRLREHSCDAACVARPGIDMREYAMCLLDVARNAQNKGPGTLTVALLGRRQMRSATTRSQLGQRIVWIAAGPERRASLWISAALIVAFSAMALGAMLVLRAPDGWSHERLMLSSVVNLERLETINTLAQLPLR